MTKRMKVWTRAGVAVLGATVAANAAGTNVVPMPKPQLPYALVEVAGEGGEGGASTASTVYALGSTDPNDFQYDATPQIEAYIDLVHASYQRSAEAAMVLDTAISALLANPTDETLAMAREAWVAARPAYLKTEAFRFYDGPIENKEGLINAWPMNEAYLDYVEGNPTAGLINSDESLAIGDMVALNQSQDEADVTTGWHAIEFLLWGQDLSAEGPGNRPVSDFIAGQGHNDRRREYLANLSKHLTGLLTGLAEDWATDGSSAYVQSLRRDQPREVIGRMMNGMAILAGYEVMSERLAVALDSGDQEDEHSCFSDTTKQDFVYDVAGIRQVWTGDSDDVTRAGLDELVRSIDPAVADAVEAALSNAEAKAAALGDPWDQVLAADPDSPERQDAEAFVTALQDLGAVLSKAGAKLGVLVLIPS